MASHKSSPDHPGRFAYEGLDRVIHERARLSVLTSLITNPKGLAFNDLKQLAGRRARGKPATIHALRARSSVG